MAVIWSGESSIRPSATARDPRLGVEEEVEEEVVEEVEKGAEDVEVEEE